jgi:hypothetical protein
MAMAWSGNFSHSLARSTRRTPRNTATSLATYSPAGDEGLGRIPTAQLGGKRLLRG